jgi:eukaryotic-like serine/threonine-protein kinase
LLNWSSGRSLLQASDQPNVKTEPDLPQDLRELYYVGEMLGRGGMAEVYEAIDLRTGEELAIKRLAPALAGRDQQVQRFANEIDLLDRCRGPFVLELVASGTWDGIPAYVCERCTSSLYDLARPKALPLLRVLQYCGETLVGLDRVHANGCVHRDIKPANILLTADHAVRLADFGIARHPNRRLTAAGHKMGTPCYAAPDLAADPRKAEPAHDLYAVGLLLLRLSTHLHPRVLTDSREAERTLDRFPPATAHLLRRATSQDAAERYTSASEMAVDVHHAIENL